MLVSLYSRSPYFLNTENMVTSSWKARTRLYQFIDKTNVWRFSFSRKGINFQVEIWAYILKERNLKRVSLFVAYSWQRLYVSYKMEWLSWHSWIILSRAEEYAISSSMAGTSISATDSACLIFAADLEKYDFICCGDKNSPTANRRSPFSFLARRISLATWDGSSL